MISLSVLLGIELDVLSCKSLLEITVQPKRGSFNSTYINIHICRRFLYGNSILSLREEIRLKKTQQKNEQNFEQVRYPHKKCNGQ